jgi:hypothetical protein
MKNFRKLFLASTLLTLSNSSFLGAMDNNVPMDKKSNTSSTSSPCNNSNIYNVKSLLTEKLSQKVFKNNRQEPKKILKSFNERIKQKKQYIKKQIQENNIILQDIKEDFHQKSVELFDSNPNQIKETHSEPEANFESDSESDFDTDSESDSDADCDTDSDIVCDADSEEINKLIQIGNWYTYSAAKINLKDANKALSFYELLLMTSHLKEKNLDAFLTALYMVGERVYLGYRVAVKKYEHHQGRKLALPYLEEFISYDRSQKLNLEFWLNAQYVIGEMYYTGDGVDKIDIGQALTHLEKVVAHEQEAQKINSPAYVLSKELIAKIKSEKE